MNKIFILIEHDVRDAWVNIIKADTDKPLGELEKEFLIWKRDRISLGYELNYDFKEWLVYDKGFILSNNDNSIEVHVNYIY